MTIKVRIPAPLRTLTGGKDEVTAEGGTVRAVVDSLDTQFPGIKARLVDEKGVRRSVNIFLNDEDIRFFDSLETSVKSGDALDLIPAIAGGA